MSAITGSILNDVIVIGTGIFVLAIFYSIAAAFFKLPSIRELIRGGL